MNAKSIKFCIKISCGMILSNWSMRNKFFISGICGGTASGKTTVATKIIESLDVPWVTLLSMDSFYKVNRHIRKLQILHQLPYSKIYFILLSFLRKITVKVLKHLVKHFRLIPRIISGCRSIC